MNLKMMLISLICVISIITIILILNGFEAHAVVRCDGKPIFPFTQNDSIFEGEIKLNNAIFSKMGGSIKLYNVHSTSTNFNFLWSTFEKDCYFQRTSEWHWR